MKVQLATRIAGAPMTIRRLVLFAALFSIGVSISTIEAAEGPEATPPKTGDAAKPLPKFDDIQQAVVKQLALGKDYQPGDLLTDAAIAPIFRSIEELGWNVQPRKEIERLFLPENDWLAKQLRTKKGKIFMRNVAKNADGFDRIDRLRRMPGGEKQLSELIQSPEGFKMVEYMTTTPGGKNLGKQLSRGKNGANFNEPTGRLYTQKQLIERLKQLHHLQEQQTRRDS
ncbi:MAG: hypothetical protein AB7O26_09805 [Planctomycetaceae bacterium]